MKNPEAFIEKVRAVNPGNYWAAAEELNAIRTFAKEDFFDSMCMMFQYGFLRGQNAEKNKRRKKKA
jgi:hypothetical protein